MMSCELCKSKAKVYCDSDMASLCWSCDAKVHSANFLVARHSRSLLCQICQSPTAWSASGEKLFPSTASICGRCVVEGISDDDDDREERVGGNDDEFGTDSDDEFDGDGYADELDLEAPPATSSSSSEGFSIADCGVSLKRKRLNFEDDLDCSSVNLNLTLSSTMSEPAETRTLLSTRSSSEETAGKFKRIRQRNIISGNR